MPFLGKRFAEVFVLEIVLSVFCTVCLQFDMFSKYPVAAAILLALCLAINIGYLIYCLKMYLGSVHQAMIYYKTNLFVFALLALCSLGLSLMPIEPLYSYVFYPFRLFCITSAFSDFASALAVNGIIFLCILIIPCTTPEYETEW